MMRLSLINKGIHFCLVALVFVFVPFTAHAQVNLTQTQALSFGTFTFNSFNATGSLNIRNNGGFNASANIVVLTPPTRGEFEVDAPGDPNSVYTVTFPATFNLTGPGGVTIPVDNVRVRPNTLRTNGVGFDTFRIMARINTSSGVQYGNGAYVDDILVSVNF